MTPPPNRADCSSAKDYVRQAQVWARKHGVNKPVVNERLKRPQEPASASCAGPLLSTRPFPTTGLKRPSADSLDQSSKRPCPADPQTLGLAARFSACPRDSTPIVLSPEPAFPQAPGSHLSKGHRDGTKQPVPYSFRFTSQLPAVLSARRNPASQSRPRLLDPHVGVHGPAFSAGQYHFNGAWTPCPANHYCITSRVPWLSDSTPSSLVAGLLNCQIAEISRDLRNTFPKNPLWEEAVFPAAAVVKCVGAFRNMYRALLHVSAVTPAQHRRRYAFFLVGINRLVKRLELAVVVPTNKHTLRAQQNLEEALRNEPHPAQPTAAEYNTPIPPERTRRSSESKLP
ncbi:hypothetical protein PTTG_09591 [Puccinia triticina 1-1 BBBD Race 1]|uniref:Uncharacterized protein n=1 Tax=Puccinia triticina (isolate 1-1 / race 1 (BBBD)) TaxID=630390 RepID=A0A0C4F8T6_PUCT1|nr:hypothetical protein PTTG_09591 [Puccinia triticina 1-1 BBBD Race 1]